MRKSTKAESPKFSSRIRFNWGFHDGQADAVAGRKPFVPTDQNPDRDYARGYLAGVDEFKATGKRNESSEPAWLVHRTAAETARDERRALKNARPDTRIIRI